MSHARAALIPLFAMLVCLAPCHPDAHADGIFELIYCRAGDFSDVAVDGQLAYVVGGGMLKIFDVSTPSAPVALCSTGTAGDRGALVAVADGRAYVLVGTDLAKINGPVLLRIYDVTDPEAPVLLGSHSLGDDTPGGIVVSGSYAYVTVSFSGLLGKSGGVGYGGDFLILDVSEPSVYNEVGAYEFTEDTPYRLHVAKGLAYIGCGFLINGALHIFDVSEPSDPTPVSAYQAAGAVSGVDLEGDVAYLSWLGPMGANGGVEVVDVANPQAPSQLGVQDFGWAALGMAVHNGAAFVPTMYFGLAVADVTNPEAMRPAGYYFTSDWALAVTLADGLVYLATEDEFFILRCIGVGNGEISEPPCGGWFEVGDPLELCVGVSGMMGALSYQWLKDDEALPGETDACYIVDAVALADDGWYVCRVSDGGKTVYETDPVHVEVFAVGSLPAAAACGLALLVAACGLAGGRALWRKRAPSRR